MASNRASTIKDMIVIKTEEMALNKANNGAESRKRFMQLTHSLG